MIIQREPAVAGNKLNADDKVALLTKAQTIKRDAATKSGSIAMRSRMGVNVNQLSGRVVELDPDPSISASSHAILEAFNNKEWDALVAACDAFALAIEGKLPHTPVAELSKAIDAPAPPAAPVADLAVPVRAHDDPEPPYEKIAKATGCHAFDRSVSESAPAPVGGLASVMELGKTIRIARVRKRMTQQQAASVAGVGRRFVVELEGGKLTSEVGRVLAVCQAVGIFLTATAA